MSRATAPPERLAPAPAQRPPASRLRHAALGVAIAAPLALLWLAAERAPRLLFVFPLAINVALAVAFARTLREGREPLISVFARAERGRLEPDLVRYTRRLTRVWVVFFLVVATAIALLAVAAPPPALVAFIAIGNPLLVVALFVGEYAFRRRRYAHYRHASPLALAAIVYAYLRRTTRH